MGNGPSPPPPPFNVETMATRPSRKRPSEWQMWTFLGSFPIVYRGKSQHWRGGRGREGYFPNKKIDEIRRFATEIGPKIAHFRPNRTLKQSILKSSCFHWSSRAQKSVSPLHRSIQFQTWNLHKNAWNFIKLHRPTQFQTWNLHKNMINCIARHNFKLGNDVFSNENGGPGILDFCCLYLSSKCIKKTSWFMLYSGIR